MTSSHFHDALKNNLRKIDKASPDGRKVAQKILRDHGCSHLSQIDELTTEQLRSLREAINDKLIVAPANKDLHK